MSGYVNEDRGGWTELRVHGVSGAPPESILQHSQVVQVAGDSGAGFFRRRWDSGSVAEDTAARRVEAYSWGSLTAGSGQRALWLLLMPFLLVNVAFWAMPYVARDGDPARRRRTWRVAEAVQRLFALSITLTLVLATVSASMDLIGWQCVRAAGNCGQRLSWLGFLTWPWLDQPGRRLAVTALVPLATVLLLWWLARKTWVNFESAGVPGAPATDQETPLENRKIWNGMGPVRKLRTVHVTAALAVIGLLLTAPLVDAGAGPLARAVVGVLVALTALAVVLVC